LGKVLGEETANPNGFWGNNWWWIIVVLVIGSGIFWFARRRTGNE